MNKVHFASLMCVDFDMDLFEKWMKHYRRFSYDSYYLYFHTNSVNKPEAEYLKIMNRAGEYGFNSSWVFGPFNDGELRSRYLGTYHDLLPENDYLVTADSDEFHDIPDPENFKSVITSHETVEGFLVDCWGSLLEDSHPDIALKYQYPFEGNFEKQSNIMGIIHPNRKKIIAAKCSLAVNYIGSHCVYNRNHPGETVTYSRPDLVRVLHYTFRSSLPWRMAGKNYFRSEDLYNMLKYFNIESHPALDNKMKYEDAVQVEKGWIPS